MTSLLPTALLIYVCGCMQSMKTTDTCRRSMSAVTWRPWLWSRCRNYVTLSRLWKMTRASTALVRSLLSMDSPTGVPPLRQAGFAVPFSLQEKLVAELEKSDFGLYFKGMSETNMYRTSFMADNEVSVPVVANAACLQRIEYEPPFFSEWITYGSTISVVFYCLSIRLPCIANTLTRKLQASLLIKFCHTIHGIRHHSPPTFKPLKWSWLRVKSTRSAESIREYKFRDLKTHCNLYAHRNIKVQVCL